MASVRSSDRLKKNQHAPSQSAVSTNQGSAVSATGGSTKRTAATKALKTTRQPGASKNKSVGAKPVRRRVVTKATGKKMKSQPQSVEEQIDDSESDEQEMTNVVTDETEQRGRKNRSIELDKDGRRLRVTSVEGEESPWMRRGRSNLGEERLPIVPSGIRSRSAVVTRGLAADPERDDSYGKGQALRSSTRPRSHSREKSHSRGHWVHSPDGRPMDVGGRVRPFCRTHPEVGRVRRESSRDREQSVEFSRREEISSRTLNYRPPYERTIDPSIEMPSFDGSGDVELFLQRFETLVEFFKWTEREQVFRIKQCVKADAQYMLLDICRSDNIEEVIDALRKRFGVNTAHAERYRAELGQLRKGKFTLEQLHVKVRTLVSKSAPGPWTALTEIYARDAFLAALDDWDLRKRIMMTCPPPTTLAATYDLALRSAALETGMSSQQRSGSPSDQRSRRARMLGNADESEASKKLQELTASNDQLRRQIEDLQKSLQQLRTCGSTSQTITSGSQRPNSERANDVCHRCGQTGHWARNCGNQKNRKTTQNQNQSSSRANPLMEAKPKVKVYIKVNFQGKTHRVLVDTGCDISVLSTKVLPNLKYRAGEHSLYAANLSKVPVLGRATVCFGIADLSIESEFLVTDAIEELIFGADWLEQNRCIWDFDSSSLIIRACPEPRKIPLIHAARKDCVRRLYAAETVELAPYSQLDLSVKSIWSTRPPAETGWMVEPKNVGPSVMLARTVINADGATAYVRVANCGSEPYKLHEGELLTTAEAIPLDRVAFENTAGLAPPTEGCRSEAESSTDSGKQNGSDRPNGTTSYEHVQELIDSLPAHLDNDQKKTAADFIRKYANVFSRSVTDLGRNAWLPHRIDTGDHPPIRQQLRRQPYAHQVIIDKATKEMREAKVIEPSTAEWASNLVVVSKKDGTARVCVDTRFLNNVTKRDCYPLPRIDTCLDSLGGSRFFSTLDLRSGFWQTEVAEQDRDKTTFITRSGAWRFCVLPFGLKNAPSQFQRLMDMVMAGILWEACIVYMDDLIIMAPTFELHLERLAAVFDRLLKANLKAKVSKCQLFKDQVSFLGHRISARGVEVCPEKIRTIANWPRPQNLTELRSFLGLSSYYRRFVEGFAKIAKPLHSLTEKDTKFHWDWAQEEAFYTLKEKLITAPILASPTDEGEYVLDTDASLVGLGAVLQQQQGEHLRVIAYGSRSLSKAERNYSTTKRELLAVVYGLKQYRQFLLGRHFKLRVDHAALTYLRKTPEVIGQAARWMDLIEEYDFDITHRAGVAHGNCDALSRRPESELEATPTVLNPVLTRDKTTADDTMQSLLCSITDFSQTGIGAIATAQQADPALKPLIQALKVNGSRPDWSEVQAMSEDTRILWAQYDSLELVDDVLVRKFYKAEGTVMHKQIVIPEALREEFLKEIHQPDLHSATSHLGVHKTQEHVMRRAYWTTWKTDTEKYCRRCNVCQSLKHGPAPKHGLMRVNEANGFGDLMNIDLTGPHPPSRQGCRYILTAMDAYTRFLIAVPLRNKTAEIVATALVNSAFVPYGCWLRLNSDQGGEFNNAVLQHVTCLLNIHKTRTTAYRPQSNGRCERVHRTINDLMAKVVSDSQRDWQDRLPMIVAAYNAAHHSTTGHSPFYLVFGREYRIPLDLVLAIGETETEEDRHEYADQLRERIQDAYRLVNERLKTTTERMKRRYDTKVKPIQFEIGQLALYYCPRKQVGRNQKWRRLQRLCMIVKKLNDVLYCVKLGPWAKSTVVHVDRLYKFCGDPPPKWKKCVNNQLTNELGRSTEENNTGPIVASNDAIRDEYGQPADYVGHTGTTTSPSTGNASSAAAQPQDVTSCEPGSPAGRRPQRTRHKPHRYRDVNSLHIQTLPSLYEETEAERLRIVDSRNHITLRNINMDLSAGSSTSQKVGTIRKRSEKEKAKRRNREKGPHPCPLCDHTPFKSISGLRAHVIGVHQKHCSWTKRISDLKPADVTEASRPVLGVDNIEVRVLHLAGSSSVEISDGCDINNGEQSVIIDLTLIDSD